MNTADTLTSLATAQRSTYLQKVYMFLEAFHDKFEINKYFLKLEAKLIVLKIKYCILVEKQNETVQKIFYYQWYFFFRTKQKICLTKI